MKTIFTKKEHTDSGLALIFLLLLLFFYFKLKIFLVVAVLVCLISMTYSPAIYPFTFIWLNFSHVLGNFMSKIILFVVFCVFVIPIATIRKWMGKDSLMLKKFKKDSSSVFVVRNHTFSKTDIEKPY